MPTEEIGVITSYEVQGEDKVIRANKDIENSTRKVTQAMQGETRAGEDLSEAEIALGLEKARLQGITDLTTDTLRKLAREQSEVKEKTQQTTNEIKKQDTETGRLIKKTALWALGVRTVFVAYNRVRRAIVGAVKDIFENTQEAERLTDAWDNLKASLVLALIDFEDTKQLLGEIADAMDDVSASALQLSAEFVGITAAGAAVQAQIPTMDAETAALAEQMEGLGASLGIGKQALLGVGAEMGALGPENQRLAETTSDVAEAEKRASDAAALAARESRNYQKAVESLARTMRSAASAQAEFAARQDEITAVAATDRVQAATDRFSGLMEVESNLRAEIADINRDANRATERATTRHQRNLTRITDQAGRKRAQAIAQNRLREQFDERRFDLSTLQSERLYLAERARLAAQGDVLAIDELDERFALQKEIEEENFRLQQQRQEATFQLQLRFQEQAARQQAQILTEALAEQLRTIEEGRQEQVAEAETAAQEKEMQVKGEFALEIAAIDAQEKLKLAELEKGWNERLAKEADSLAALRDQYDLTTGQIMNIWRLRFGSGGELDQIMQAAILRRLAELRAVRAALSGLGTITTGGGRVIPTRYRAHGGDEIVSSPTMFMAGEGGPERVITQPLSSIGGAMTVRWQGGAIPLEGRGGGLENLDLAPVGQALAQGLTVSIMEAFLRQRGNWGR